MSKVLDNIKGTDSIDVVHALRGGPEKGGVYLVETTITKFKTREAGGADVLKKVNAYAEAKTLEEAQNKSLEKAGILMGLGG